GSERKRRTGQACLASACATGASSAKAPSAGARALDRPQFSSAGPLVEKPDLEPPEQVAAGVDHPPFGDLSTGPAHSGAANRGPHQPTGKHGPGGHPDGNGQTDHRDFDARDM